MKNDKKPLISVIIAVYNCTNRENFEKSIDSILTQTYQNFEIIVCNDGSTDSTLDIIRDVARKDSRIKVISYKHNKGLAYALNYCLKYSKGDFIARQDVDDISYPDRFQIEMEFLFKYPQIGFVSAVGDIYDVQGIWGKYTLKAIPRKSDFLWNSPYLHAATIFRKSVLEYAGGYRVSWETQRAEDYDLFMRLYAQGIKGYNIQKSLYCYYIDRNEKKHRKMNDRIQEAIVRYKGFNLLNIGIKSAPYIIKPIILGLIPGKLMNAITKNKYSV